MSQITLILDSIFKNNGGTTRQWRTANEILLTHTDEIKKYCSYMKTKIRDLNRDTQLLALDFLDYSIDDGKIPLWTQVGSKEFLSSLVNIYKTRNDEEVKNKILYLIQKWNNKFKKYNTIIPNFNLTYENLKENEVDFPDNMESTYEKYLQSGNSGNSNNNSNQITNLDINSNSNSNSNSDSKNYLKKINLDLRPSSYERKYKRLVNKLDDLTVQIQDANVFMDKADENGFDDELRGICSELETGKGQLVDTIESGKLKDEKLMAITENVKNDIDITLKRWNDVKNGKKPDDFRSCFFDNQKRENNNNSNNNNNQNKGGFDLLGFGDELNDNNNNGNNLGNDLFGVFSGNNNNNANMNNNNNNQGNDFFGNMGNNNNVQNNNQNLFDINGNNNNAQQNNQNNFNNDFFGNNNMNNSNNQNFQNQNNNNQGNDFSNFGNNNIPNNNNQNNNQNFMNNNFDMNQNQNNQNQNNGNNNDLFSQLFNNNNQNNTNINNLQNNLNSVYSETNQFGSNIMNMNMNNNINNNNNNMNKNNNMNNNLAFNSPNFSNINNNNNFNFNDSNNKNNAQKSNNDFVFNF